MSSHYDWLYENLPTIFKYFKRPNIDPISAHGDKFSAYEDFFKENNIPFAHGVALGLMIWYDHKNDDSRSFIQFKKDTILELYKEHKTTLFDKLPLVDIVYAYRHKSTGKLLMCTYREHVTMDPENGDDITGTYRYIVPKDDQKSYRLFNFPVTTDKYNLLENIQYRYPYSVERHERWKETTTYSSEDMVQLTDFCWPDPDPDGKKCCFVMGQQDEFTIDDDGNGLKWLLDNYEAIRISQYIPFYCN